MSNEQVLDQAEADAPRPEQKQERKPFIEMAEDADGWHWCLWSGNGRMMARNAIAFPERKQCLGSIKIAKAVFAEVTAILEANG